MYAINFYSPIYADQLRKGRKSATIRLGDASAKYQDGQVVWITVGQKYSPRHKLFAAILDKVDVKRIGDLSRSEIKKENPELRRPEEILDILVKIYDKPLSLDDLITVIQFSEIRDIPTAADFN